jgi:hypothetical protein
MSPKFYGASSASDINPIGCPIESLGYHNKKCGAPEQRYFGQLGIIQLGDSIRFQICFI